jgi:GxxExxY protein
MVDLLKEYKEKRFELKEETYAIIGACMEVHRHLGRGFSEIVYKDALEHEFHGRNIPYEREKNFEVQYKGVTLRHSFSADFIVFDSVILEAKAQTNGWAEGNSTQLINYLAISKCAVGLLVNFGENSLQYRRLVL